MLKGQAERNNGEEITRVKKYKGRIKQTKI